MNENIWVFGGIYKATITVLLQQCKQEINIYFAINQKVHSAWNKNNYRWMENLQLGTGRIHS